MMSLVQVCLMLTLSSLAVDSTPLNYKSTTTTPNENHQDELQKDNLRNIKTQDLKHESLSNGHLNEFLERSNRVDEMEESLKKSLSLFFIPQIKEFNYNSRRKRELRSPRKISSGSMSMQMPAYYPFLMAEMMPGSVKTRHPSIIAVNGCPAYYIADHKGKCRQVFQYTVNFGQNSPKSPDSFQPQHAGYNENKPYHDHSFNHQQAPSPSFLPRQVPKFTPTPISKTPSILSLLRNATKKFDLSFLKKQNNSSSSSSESNNNEENIDKLRKKILSALKITKNSDSDSKKDEKSDNSGSETTTSKPDCDD